LGGACDVPPEKADQALGRNTLRREGGITTDDEVERLIEGVEQL